MIFLPADWRWNMAIWIVVWGTLIAWQMFTTRAPERATFGDVVGLARRSWILRWAMLLFWAWLGWHIFVRTHA